MTCPYFMAVYRALPTCDGVFRRPGLYSVVHQWGASLSCLFVLTDVCMDLARWSAIHAVLSSQLCCQCVRQFVFMLTHLTVSAVALEPHL